MTIIMRQSELLARFEGRDILSMNAISREEIEAILDYSELMRDSSPADLLRGNILASCFFEPSTRTRLSFEAAMKRLGGDVIGFANNDTNSTRKGESLHDTIRVIGSYADVIVIRHPLEGAARQAADATAKPVINAGDGSNQHPTQTLLDLLTIRQRHGHLQDLHVACVGDLRYGPTVHSLVQALAHYQVRLYFVAPPMLELPVSLCEELKAKGILFSFHSTLESVVSKVDVLYMTRVQQERLSGPIDISEQMQYLTVTPDILRNAKETLSILHPLPRRWEITPEVDHSPHAAYFDQAANGLCVRQALLSLVLGKKMEANTQWKH